MKFGIYLPNYGQAIHPRFLAEAAQAAEAAGWDGFFLWDHVLVSKNQGYFMVDPWVTLAAMATMTERIRLGTTVTPVARRRPWKLARETVSLDQLSGGRLTLAVGLGAPVKAEFGLLGEQTDNRIRAEKLDEGLEILTGLWSGKPFEFHGKHYDIARVTFKPKPIQQPRIPIWVGGYSSRQAPFRRAARFDGAFPLKQGSDFTAKELHVLAHYIHQHRQYNGPFDLVLTGDLAGKPSDFTSQYLHELQGAGLTWWLESLYRYKDNQNELMAAIRQGPPVFTP